MLTHTYATKASLRLLHAVAKHHGQGLFVAIAEANSERNLKSKFLTTQALRCSFRVHTVNENGQSTQDQQN